MFNTDVYLNATLNEVDGSVMNASMGLNSTENHRPGSKIKNIFIFARKVRLVYFTHLVSSGCVFKASSISGITMVKQVLGNAVTECFAKPSSSTVGPSPLGYCSVARQGKDMILAASSTRLLFETTSSKWEIIGRNLT